MRHLKFGLLVSHEEEATAGYTLFSPLHGPATYLIDLRGDVVHQWEHPLINSTYAYLLENGNLLWAGRLPEGPQHMGGRGGLLREYDWDGHPAVSSKSGAGTTAISNNGGQLLHTTALRPARQCQALRIASQMSRTEISQTHVRMNAAQTRRRNRSSGGKGVPLDACRRFELTLAFPTRDAFVARRSLPGHDGHEDSSLPEVLNPYGIR